MSDSNDNAIIRVLVVGDHQEVEQSVTDILRNQGCEIQIVHNAMSALEAAKRTPPAIIFSSLSLPGEMNGFGLARQIRQIKILIGIPLVAITSNADEHDKMAAIAAGFNMVFVKPVQFTDLTKALQTYVKEDL